MNYYRSCVYYGNCPYPECEGDCAIEDYNNDANDCPVYGGDQPRVWDECSHECDVCDYTEICPDVEDEDKDEDDDEEAEA